MATMAACSSGGHVEFETRAAVSAQQAGAGGAAGATATGPAVSGGLLPGSPGGAAAAPGARAAAGSPAGTTGAAGGGEVIKLGTVLPLEGGQRALGEPVLRTTQAFIDELNARGGVNGRKIQLISYSACLVCQDDALTAVRRLVEQDGVFAIVNTIPMVVAFQPVIGYLTQKGVPLVQGGAENQTTDALSPVNFATLPTGLFYVRFLSVLAAQHEHFKRVALVYVNVPSESNGVPQIERELARQGVQVTDKEPVNAQEDAVTNMDSVVTRMRASGAEGVVATNPVVLIFGRLAASRQGWQAHWVGEAAWSTLVETGCGTTCDDVVLTDTAGLSFIDRGSPQMRQYLDTMARRFPGGEVSGLTLASWVGMQLTTEMLARSGTDRAAFIRALESTTNLDLGTTAPLRFGPDRHLGGTATELLRLKGGRYVRVSEPLNYGEAPPP
jgi:branched-chain amino acid transport system substrate-binding protein